MTINESDYKKIYNVVECAGITNTDMTDWENALDAYNKIADWINNDPELSSCVVAKVEQVNATYNSYVLTITDPVTEAGLWYGQDIYNTGRYTPNSYGTGSYRYNVTANGGYTYTTYNNMTGITSFNLILVRSDYGYLIGIWNNGAALKNAIFAVSSTGSDDTGSETKFSYLSSSGNYLNYYYLQTDRYNFNTGSSNLDYNNNSARTLLTTNAIRYTTIISDNVKKRYGHTFGFLSFFEAGGCVWCDLARESTYGFFALRIV